MLWVGDAQHHHKLFSSSVNADKPDMPDCCYAEPSRKGKERQVIGRTTCLSPSNSNQSLSREEKSLQFTFKETLSSSLQRDGGEHFMDL